MLRILNDLKLDTYARAFMSSLFLTKLTGALLQSATYELPVAYHVMHVKIFSFVTITLRTMIAKKRQIIYCGILKSSRSGGAIQTSLTSLWKMQF